MLRKWALRSNLSALKTSLTTRVLKEEEEATDADPEPILPPRRMKPSLKKSPNVPRKKPDRPKEKLSRKPDRPKEKLSRKPDRPREKLSKKPDRLKEKLRDKLPERLRMKLRKPRFPSLSMNSSSISSPSSCTRPLNLVALKTAFLL